MLIYNWTPPQIFFIIILCESIVPSIVICFFWVTAMHISSGWFFHFFTASNKMELSIFHVIIIDYIWFYYKFNIWVCHCVHLSYAIVYLHLYISVCVKVHIYIYVFVCLCTCVENEWTSNKCFTVWLLFFLVWEMIT